MAKHLRGPSLATLLTLSLLLLPVYPTHAQSAPDTSFIGTLTNGTQGSVVPQQVPVVLRFYSGMSWTDTFTTTLSADGSYRFTGLDALAGQEAVASVDHQGVTYYSRPLKVESGQATVGDILIYDTTEDISAVQVDQVHFFIVPQAGIARIAEFYLIGNAGDRTFIGKLDPQTGMHTTVAFSLPAGATDLTFDGAGIGERFIGDTAHFADSRPILPGTATVEVNFSYSMPYEQGTTFERALGLPIASVAVLVNSEDIGVQSDVLQPGGFMNTQMGMAAAYQGGPLAAGEALSFTFVPQTMKPPAPAPQASVTAPSERGDDLVLTIVAVAIGAAGGIWFWLRPKARASTPVPVAAQTIVQQIIDLDRSFANGDMDEAEHTARVNQLREQLHELARERSPH